MEKIVEAVVHHPTQETRGILEILEIPETQGIQGITEIIDTMTEVITEEVVIHQEEEAPVVVEVTDITTEINLRVETIRERENMTIIIVAHLHHIITREQKIKQ